MAWLDSFVHGDALSEILIEGRNPYGANLLKESDVELLRNLLAADERVLGYVLGRVVLAGRGLWLLTDRQLLVSEQEAAGAVHRYALSDITAFACVKGKYGYTLRVTAAGQLRSLYAAAPHMAAALHAALGRTVQIPPVVKPPLLSEEDVAEVVHRVSDASARLQPLRASSDSSSALMAQVSAQLSPLLAPLTPQRAA
jgi:hypothetical protein